MSENTPEEAKKPAHQTLVAVCDILMRKGFDGVRFDTVCPDGYSWEDWEGDGRSRETFELWRRNYASFVLHPSFPILTDLPESRYIEEPSFDTGRFYDDLVAWLQEQFGPEFEIEYGEHSDQFEVQNKPVIATIQSEQPQ